MSGNSGTKSYPKSIERLADIAFGNDALSDCRKSSHKHPGADGGRPEAIENSSAVRIDVIYGIIAHSYIRTGKLIIRISPRPSADLGIIHPKIKLIPSGVSLFFAVVGLIPIRA